MPKIYVTTRISAALLEEFVRDRPSSWRIFSVHLRAETDEYTMTLAVPEAEAPCADGESVRILCTKDHAGTVTMQLLRNE